jgi:LysR family transcriptional regulator, hydrogen peroxide-inducible genes activator
MMNLPSLRYLRHLMALHDHGHFGRAAEACGVTQSTLSASTQKLADCRDVRCSAEQRFAPAR